MWGVGGRCEMCEMCLVACGSEGVPVKVRGCGMSHDPVYW